MGKAYAGDRAFAGEYVAIASSVADPRRDLGCVLAIDGALDSGLTP